MRLSRYRGRQQPGEPVRRLAGLGGLLGLFALLGALPWLAAAQAPTFANLAFQRTWEHTDKPVAAGTAQRGYYWGPQPGTVKQEAYAEATGGARQVQYF